MQQRDVAETPDFVNIAVTARRKRALVVECNAAGCRYRQRFKKDVVVDLVCYRRLGHNEQDEPLVTQPLMYKVIHQHPTTRQIYAERLIREGVLSAEDAEGMVTTFRAAMDAGQHTNSTIMSN